MHSLNDSTPHTKRLIKHSTTYAIGNIARRLIGFVMLPVYTRYLTPADYGVVGLLTFAIAIMEPFFGARLGIAMPKYYFDYAETSRRDAVISTALILTGSASIATASVLFLLRGKGSVVLFGSNEYALVVGLSGIQILTQALEYYGMTFIRIQQRSTMFIGVSLSKLALQLTLNILFVVWMRLGVLGVVISGVASSSLYALGLSLYIISKVGLHFDRPLAKAMLAFSWPLWLVGLSSLYIYSGSAYFLRIFGSLSNVGLYELATRFSAVLDFVIWAPFNQYWETERFKQYRNGANRTIYSSVFRYVSVLLVLAALGINLSAEPIIRVMASSDFYNAYMAVPILTTGAVLTSLTMFMNFSFLIRERTRRITFISYMTAGVITILNITLIPWLGMVGAAAALAGALLFQFVVSYFMSRKCFDVGVDLRASLLMVGLLAVASYVADYAIRTPGLAMDIVQRAAVLAVAVVALAGILMMNHEARSQIRPVVRAVLSKLSG